MLRVHEDQLPAIEELLTNPDILRISGYVNGRTRHHFVEAPLDLTRLADTFKVFAPDLYKFYKARMDEILERDKQLKAPFQNTVFACTAFNFGPKAISTPHRDQLNLAFGWCSITALGDFNHASGGHLVLPELKLAIEFPAGSTILIPSAMLTHYNLPIAPEESRHSITQFSAGGLFRWISYGFQEKGVAKGRLAEGEEWWEKGRGLYTIWPTKNSSFEEGGVSGAMEKEQNE